MLTASSLKTGRDFHAAVGRTLLRRLVRQFRPHILHGFGASTGGLFALSALEPAGLLDQTKLVVQARGGPDLIDGVADPALREPLERLFRRCDLLICDNTGNYELATAHGCAPERQFGKTVPGTGGLEICGDAPLPPSKRDRLLFIPKGYEGYQSKVLPMLEGLRVVWHAVQPIKVLMTAVNQEAENAIRRLPEDIRTAIDWHHRVERQAVLKAMGQARVMLAPSLLDGVPNVLYEAMQGGAAPVISPLSGVLPVFENERHVLYARNLYADEIGAAVLRLMNDDTLADRLAGTNRTLLPKLACRERIRDEVVAAYRQLAGEALVA